MKTRQLYKESDIDKDDTTYADTTYADTTVSPTDTRNKKI